MMNSKQEVLKCHGLGLLSRRVSGTGSLRTVGEGEEPRQMIKEPGMDAFLSTVKYGQYPGCWGWQSRVGRDGWLTVPELRKWCSPHKRSSLIVAFEADISSSFLLRRLRHREIEKSAWGGRGSGQRAAAGARVACCPASPPHLCTWLTRNGCTQREWSLSIRPLIC